MTHELPRWRGHAADSAGSPSSADSLSSAGKAAQRARSRRRGRALLRDLLRPYRGSLALAVLLLLAQNGAAVAGPYLIMIGIDQGIVALDERHDARILIAVSIAFAVSAIVEYVARRGFLTVSARVGQAVLLNLRTRVYRQFQRLSIAFHDRYTAGAMVSRLTNDMDSIAEFLDGGVEGLVLAGLSVTTVAGILLWLDPPLAAVTLLTFPFLAWLSRWFAAESTGAYRRTRETVALVVTHFVESLGGVRAVQAFRREHRDQQIFAAVNEDYRQAFVRVFRLVARYAPGLKLTGNIAIAIVLGYGGWRVTTDRLDVGVLTAFLLYLRRFFDPMQEMSQYYNALQSATAALEKLSGILDERPTVPEPPQPEQPQPEQPQPGQPQPGQLRPGQPAERNIEGARPRGAIELRGVTFGYQPDAPVLTKLQVAIPAGQTVALVGATGAGKSTVAKLVARFYDPDSGSVRLDGRDLRHIPDTELRRDLIVVTQEVFLFAGTVADNIRFGRPDATDEELTEAARAIGADEFIALLPHGYETDVRDRGSLLSAGQRQLVAFARAFLADPAILILDEATSSLDVPSERLVQRALRTILADRTALVIAHRLSTVRIADRVLVMDAGSIVEDGPPDRLISAGGRYAALHRQWRNSLR